MRALAAKGKDASLSNNIISSRVLVFRAIRSTVDRGGQASLLAQTHPCFGCDGNGFQTASVPKVIPKRLTAGESS